MASGTVTATQFAVTYTNNFTTNTAYPTLPPGPIAATGTVTIKFPRQREMKVHLSVKTGEIQGLPTVWAACNVRSRPDWFQKNYPLMSEKPQDVTCKNCLRRM